MIDARVFWQFLLLSIFPSFSFCTGQSNFLSFSKSITSLPLEPIFTEAASQIMNDPSVDVLELLNVPHLYYQRCCAWWLSWRAYCTVSAFASMGCCSKYYYYLYYSHSMMLKVFPKLLLAYEAYKELLFIIILKKTVHIYSQVN